MIENIEINNYKTIERIKIPLGRVNILIGENGAGKSNILEAIALAGAAAAEKLDNEFLSSRGIRLTAPKNMRPKFPGFSEIAPITVKAEAKNNESAEYSLTNDNTPYSKWLISTAEQGSINLTFDSFLKALESYREYQKANSASPEQLKSADAAFREFAAALTEFLPASGEEKPLPKKTFTHTIDADNKFGQLLREAGLKNSKLSRYLSNFVIYSPENSALRTLQRDGQIEPLGINGEGVLRLLSVHMKDSPEIISKIKEGLKVLGWFEDFRLVEELSIVGLEVKDRYLDREQAFFEASSTNEGFLFLLFYLLLFTSNHTPDFFAIDNIDASLNPKLCEKLIRVLVKIAKASDKQIIMTTHNPSILDGLNLDDEDQRLFVISRGSTGKTRLKRISKPASPSNAPRRLSEMFLRGLLGGLPKTF